MLYTKNESSKGGRPANLMLGGQHPVYPDEELDPNLVILGAESGNVLVLAHRATPSAVSAEASAGGVGQTEVDVRVQLDSDDESEGPDQLQQK